MNINGINSSSFENQPEKNVNLSKEKGSQTKEIDYYKTNHPMEYLGRSMLSFKGSKNTYDKILQEAIDNGIIPEEELASLSKEDLNAKLNLYNKHKNIKPESLGLYIKCVNAQTADFMGILLSDDKFLQISDDEYFAEEVSEILLRDFDESNNDVQANICKKLEVLEYLKTKENVNEETAFFLPIIVNAQNSNLLLTMFEDGFLDTQSFNALEDMIFEDSANLSIEQKDNLFAKRLELYKQQKDNHVLGKNSLLDVMTRMKDGDINVAQREITTITDFVEWVEQHNYISDKNDLEEAKKYTTTDTVKYIKDLVKDQIIPIQNFRYIVRTQKDPKEQEFFMSKMDFYYKHRNTSPELNKELPEIIQYVSPETLDYINMLIEDETFPNDLIQNSAVFPYGNDDIEQIVATQKEIYSLLKDDSSLDKKELARILSLVSTTNKDFVMALVKDKDFSKKDIGYFAYENIRTENDIFSVREQMYNILKNTKKADGQSISDAMFAVNDANKEFVLALCKDPKFPCSEIRNVCFLLGTETDDSFTARQEILEFINKERQDLTGENIAKILKTTSPKNIDIAKRCIKNQIISTKNMAELLSNTYYSNDTSRYIGIIDFMDAMQKRSNVDVEEANNIISWVYPDNSELAVLMAEDENFPQNQIADILKYSNAEEKALFYRKFKELDLPVSEKFPELLKNIDKQNINFAIKLVDIANIESINTILKDSSITEEDVDNFINKIGKDKIERYSEGTDIITAIQFADLYQKTDINEIPISDKKNLLRKLVSSNANLFSISESLKQDFPILPQNVEEYCSILPAIVRSLGIETNDLSEVQNQEFNQNLNKLSKVLYSIEDEDFNKLTIKQEYPKEEFIQDTIRITNGLSENEKQKIFDYFGFELENNKTNSTGYSIKGYPVNLNNGKKLAKITNPQTKQVVEELRKNVIRFSEQNPITCSNKDIEPLLNEIISVLPELRPQIGKLQAGMDGASKGSHEFDVFKHSLKVMQKIVQDENFETLNESDKRVILLASLLHDITKKEGYTDATHPNESAFDSFFITNKFNMSKEEKIKLHTLIANHEWLAYINSSDDEYEQKKRMQSISYNLRHDNLFDMSLMFTHADLKAVKKSDAFHDSKDGKGRKEINGEVRSFGESAEIYAGTKTDDLNANTIRGFINELKKSQPVLPVTKFPSASRINDVITEVKPDGSTNIKGVYKDGDLVVIKYNEVEDWEQIGFPKGSISEGIHNINESTKEDINTGNIKFFIHGLDYPNQLIKFDAFSLVDSDALLSVSYAERPESKYRFFRAQGVILDTDTKYVHGGGETDAGSGCGKSIETFKNRYLFDGDRLPDRLYISKLIKETAGMTDEEYLKFVKENENKPFSEIEPKELQETIIKAFSNINSNTRTGNRAYNEMYISNPKPPMGVFAYDFDKNGTIGNPIEFLNREDKNNVEKLSVKERTGFLKEYALEHDIPFVVFGD